MSARYYCYGSGGPFTPFAIIGAFLVLVATFFIALPLFLGAVVAFGAAAAYLSWRINRAIKKAEEEFLKQERCGDAHCIEHTEYVIDITPDRDE